MKRGTEARAGWIEWVMKGDRSDLGQNCVCMNNGENLMTVVRPAMPYDMEKVSMIEREEANLKVAETRMFRFSLGMTRLKSDIITYEHMRMTDHHCSFRT